MCKDQIELTVDVSDYPGVIVGLGETVSGFTSEVEVLDFYTSSRPRSLPNFPYAAGGVLGFESNGVTLFCGGYNDTDHSNECHGMGNDGLWTAYPSLREKR